MVIKTKQERKEGNKFSLKSKNLQIKLYCLSTTGRLLICWESIYSRDWNRYMQLAPDVGYRKLKSISLVHGPSLYISSYFLFLGKWHISSYAKGRGCLCIYTNPTHFRQPEKISPSFPVSHVNDDYNLNGNQLCSCHLSLHLNCTWISQGFLVSLVHSILYCHLCRWIEDATNVVKLMHVPR